MSAEEKIENKNLCYSSLDLKKNFNTCTLSYTYGHKCVNLFSYQMRTMYFDTLHHGSTHGAFIWNNSNFKQKLVTDFEQSSWLLGCIISKLF